MRFIVTVLVILAAFLLLRSLLAPLVQAVVALLAPAPQPPARESSQGPAGTTSELKKDPVCGTFVSPELAVTGKFRGEVVHFCSAKCRDEYARRA
jgi:YHS domain-containing protein